ncbi:BadF/BadG/BcrA/BcrD ATPase family protein [Petrotoga sp. 9PW.55.5.1]|uniref:BadF/BadG/BcrA/BcrD ATPase family protein n=1 Tax=Petrotoga sp. 9PW.55.5.1 TaxID=1308979 RepID=UPI000DDBBFE9|nr:BadF/BadG/BcrA/BcrD ATPase family protein [Petrotoga sp. 9PW.55.5.1]
MRYLGMDGGGTHLAVTLIDEKKKITDRFKIDTGVNLTSVDLKRLKSILEDVHSKSQEVNGIVVSFSGAGTDKRKEVLRDILINTFNTNNVIVYNDGESILKFLFREKEIALVIAGTGALVIGMNHDKNIIRNGGWGHLFDDVGGGFWISTRIIQEAFKHRDGLREYDTIFEKLLKFYSVDKIEELTSLQLKEDFKTIISSFTKEALINPSDAVIEIIHDGLNDLSLRCKKILKLLNIKQLYFTGSLFNSEYYLNEFKKFMHGYSLIRVDTDVSEKMAFLAKEYFAK